MAFFFHHKQPILFDVIANVATENGRTIYALMPSPNRIQMAVCKEALEHVWKPRLTGNP